MTSELTTVEEQLQIQVGDDTKINRLIMAERKKVVSYNRETVRTYNTIHQLIKEKRRSCRVKAELEKTDNRPGY